MTVITWDEHKRKTNLAKHDMDFEDLDESFFLDSVTVPAKEGRSMAIGQLAGNTIAVVFLPLGSEGVAVISMRPASQKERNLLW
ncbi:MAG: BrnT family toxin [Rhodobacteraceae bacterium]|nr:BrnT family toxin [Paracoccaceae bacterium]MCY4196891.1 BrnT family toxin [Paracoccaceae bacterium]MCY4326242.1 BrnT family toxin [Paracoccaceae bacterium]